MTTQPFQYDQLFDELSDLNAGDWADGLRARCQTTLETAPHGDLPRWLEALNDLPTPNEPKLSVSDGVVTVRDEAAPPPIALRDTLMQFHPWRKGPFEILGVPIDTEWRSDWKWSRLQDHVEFRNRNILDVGSGNGYYGWRMLDAGARLVVGLDPFPLYVMQHEVVKRYAADAPNFVVPAGDDCLPDSLNLFDITLSMGVLYHRTSPIDHLQTLAGTLKSGGTLVMETIIVEDDGETVLVPEGRYAKMRNVWFLPSIPMLQRWLKRTGFTNIEVVDVTTTSIQEQRRTDWMTFESLSDFLSSEDQSKTIEGYPAPVRAIVTATKR